MLSTNIRKDIKSMDERFDEMLEYFGDEVSDTNDHFENYRKNIITVVAYLIGVPD